MTDEYLAFVDSANAAERAGDAATALEYHQGIPMFRRSAHRATLAQLADLAQEMTPWLWARWVAYQCTRAEDTGTACGVIVRLALDYTRRMFHGDAMAQAYDDGGDPVPLIANIMGEDWVYHQICTYELGGLERFLDTMVTGRLRDECGLARSWVDARMGGYRLESSSAGRLVVRDLARDQPIELLDLGARLHAGSEGWLLGRLVPSGTSPALMFDTRPLAVDRQTATEAAMVDRHGSWVRALDRAIRTGRVERTILRREDRELVTDVASLALLERGAAPGVLESAREALARGRDEIGRAAYRILRAVAEGSFGGHDDAPYVAAAAANAHGYAEAQRLLVGREHRSNWEHWARLVPEPACGRLRHLAELSAPSVA